MAFCCTRDSLNRNLEIVTSNKRCRYHRSSRQMQLSLLAPRGMCPEAFHALFPDAFASFTMPDELHDDRRSFVCPAGEVSFQIVRRPFRQLRHLPEQIVRRLASAFISCEVLKWRIFLRVSATGSCPFGQEAGEEFEVNIGNRDELCPAAAHTFYPFVVSSVLAPDAASPAVSCPDHITNVCGEVGESTGGSSTVCGNGEGATVEVVEISDEIDPTLSAGARLRVDELLERAGLPCLSLINTVAPYVAVLANGGKLGYYTDTYDAGMVQCPNPEVRVVVRIERAAQTGEISFAVESTRGPCPLGLAAGARYVLKADHGYFWLRALAILAPSLLNATLADGNEVTVVVPGEPGRSAKFRARAPVPALRMAGTTSVPAEAPELGR